jgi:integrase
LTHGEERLKALERFISGEAKPPLDILTKRSQMPPPENAILRALLDSCQYYGVHYGKANSGILRRLFWANLNFLSILVPICFGLRTNECTVLKVADFYFEPQNVERIGDLDWPPFLFVWKGDTESGEVKGGGEPRPIPIPSLSIPIFQKVFGSLALKPNDFILSNRRDRLGRSLPASKDNLERRWKEVARGAAKMFPDLGINPRNVYPYVGRQKVSTLVTDVMKDGGVYSAAILGHKGGGGKAQGKMDREHYIRPRLDELLAAMDKALEPILRDLKPPSVMLFRTMIEQAENS